jgi:hypothetical protein
LRNLSVGQDVYQEQLAFWTELAAEPFPVGSAEASTNS